MTAGTSSPAKSAQADVVIIGDGVIGLSTAYELGRAGVRCRVFGGSHHEAASGAAAGLLAPSIGTLSPSVQCLFDASRDLFPELVAGLRAFEPTLSVLEGLIDISAHPISNDRARHLTPAELLDLEPSVVATNGAAFYPRDGAIDNQTLIRALRKAVESSARATIHNDPVSAIDLDGDRVVVHARGGGRFETSTVVVAAGAWTTTIRGLPRPLPVAPLKGQMLAVRSSALRHPVMGAEVYLVPRSDEIAIGATVERAGFDTSVSPTAIENLRQNAIRICPALRDAVMVRSWAGIRPATPDMLPILGPDPAEPRLLYACGHSKNGILLAPITGKAIAALVTGETFKLDLTPFQVERFSRLGAVNA